MLMMRLQRVGRKNDPSYRIVVTDKRTGPKSNKHVALLGSYNPKMNHVQIDADAAKTWLGNGVQPSDTVHNLLVNQGLLDKSKVNALPKKAPIIDEEAEAAKKEAEEKAVAEAAAAEEEDAEAEVSETADAETKAETETESADESTDTAEAADTTEADESVAEEAEANEEGADTEEKKAA